jgi:hypothetical protein
MAILPVRSEGNEVAVGRSRSGEAGRGVLACRVAIRFEVGGDADDGKLQANIKISNPINARKRLFIIQRLGN